MKRISTWHYEEIEKYSGKICKEILEMIRNCSSRMAMDLDSSYENKFSELIMFKISHELSGKAFYLAKENSEYKQDDDIERENLIDNLGHIIDEYKNKRDSK